MTNLPVHIVVDQMPSVPSHVADIVVPFMSALLGSVVGVFGAWWIECRMFARRVAHERTMDAIRARQECERDAVQFQEGIFQSCTQKNHQNIDSLLEAHADQLNSNEKLISLCTRIKESTGTDPLQQIGTLGVPMDRALDFLRWLSPHMHKARPSFQHANENWLPEKVKQFLSQDHA